MSKIKKRRKKTANSNIENKAVMASAPAVRREFPYKAVLVTLLVLVSLIAAVLLIVNLVVNFAFSKYDYKKGETPFEMAVATETVTGDMYKSAEKIMALSNDYAKIYEKAVANYYSEQVVNLKETNKNVFNYVVAITDNSTNTEKNIAIESGNVVAVMLLSINTQQKQVTYASINKSTLVVIPSVGVGPLYDAYEFGDIKLLTRTIQENYAVKINGYVDISFASFVKAANELGGIQIGDQKFSKDTDELYEQLYQYVNESEDREAAMKDVVKALANGAKKKGVFGLNKIIKTVDDAHISDDDFRDLLWSGAKIFRGEATVVNVGYETSETIKYNDWVYRNYPDIFSVSTCDYAAEINTLHKALGLNK